MNPGMSAMNPMMMNPMQQQQMNPMQNMAMMGQQQQAFNNPMMNQGMMNQMNQMPPMMNTNNQMGINNAGYQQQGARAGVGGSGGGNNQIGEMMQNMTNMMGSIKQES